jgi:hypothetical protein
VLDKGSMVDPITVTGTGTNGNTESTVPFQLLIFKELRDELSGGNDPEGFFRWGTEQYQKGMDRDLGWGTGYAAWMFNGQELGNGNSATCSPSAKVGHSGRFS